MILQVGHDYDLDFHPDDDVVRLRSQFEGAEWNGKQAVLVFRVALTGAYVRVQHGTTTRVARKSV